MNPLDLEAGRFGLIQARPPGRVPGENYCEPCDRATPRDFCPKCGQPLTKAGQS
jgi:predicted amidophosphoribosyltransferase